MDNRKIIVGFYIVLAGLLWILSRSTIHYFYLTFYQVRRLPGIGLVNELLPVLLGAVLFGVMLRHAKVNTFSEEVVSELKRVTWPGRQDVVRSTTVVIVCILIASVILATFDLVWGKVISFLLKG